MGFEEPLYCLSDRPVSSWERCHQVGSASDFGRCIGDGNGETGLPEHRKVWEIIAYIGDLSIREIIAHPQLSIHLHLVLNSGVHLNETKLLHSTKKGLGFPSAHESDRDPRPLRGFQGDAITDVEGQYLESCGPVGDAAIGQDAIYIQEQ